MKRFTSFFRIRKRKEILWVITYRGNLTKGFAFLGLCLFLMTSALCIRPRAASGSDLLFYAPMKYGAGKWPFSVIADDFNADGPLDLAVANNFSYDVSILIGNGDGTFKDPVNYLAGNGPMSVTAGDFNGDERLDLSLANCSSNNVSIYLAINPIIPVGTDDDNCFIATAAYGSRITQDVMTFRQFRDRFLLTNRVGKAFVRLYYTCSPPVADFISKHDRLKPMVRLSLLPLVLLSHSALHLGQMLTAAGLLLVFGLLLGPITVYRRTHVQRVRRNPGASLGRL